LESELKQQTAMKNELECAVRLMDTSLNEKQILVSNLRDQLDKVKEINLDLVGQLQKLQTDLSMTSQESNELKTKLDEQTKETLKIQERFFRIFFKFDKKKINLGFQ